MELYWFMVIYDFSCYASLACGEEVASDQVFVPSGFPPGKPLAPAGFCLLAEGARDVLDPVLRRFGPILRRGQTYATPEASFETYSLVRDAPPIANGRVTFFTTHRSHP